MLEENKKMALFNIDDDLSIDSLDTVVLQKVWDVMSLTCTIWSATDNNIKRV